MPVNNTNPTTSVSDNYSKYAEYFEQSSDKTVLSIETFFQLLMAEMSNQDPLEPTSNTEFIAQLANFTALQNSSNTLYYNTVAYASSLAGKVVTVATAKPGEKGLDIQTGVVTGVDISDGTNIEITVNGKRFLLSNVMNVSSGYGSGTAGSDGAYAVSLIGKKVTLVSPTEDGSGIIDEGIVESIEIEDGEYRIVVNGYSYALSDIIKVNNPGETTAGTSSTEKGSAAEDDDEELEAQNYSNSIYNAISYAASLTGKEVTLSVYDEDTEETRRVNGIVSEVDISDRTDIGVIVGGRRYSLDNVTSVAGTTNNRFGSDGAFAVSLIGKDVSLLMQNGYSIGGVVEGITMENGQYQVVINGLSYPLTSVTTVNGEYVDRDSETTAPDTEDEGVTDGEEAGGTE